MSKYPFALAIVPGVNYARPEKLASIDEIGPDKQFRFRLDRAAEGIRNNEFWGIVVMGGVPLKRSGKTVTTVSQVGRKYLLEKLAEIPDIENRVIATGTGNFSAEEIELSKDVINEAKTKFWGEKHAYDKGLLAYISFRRHYRRALPSYRFYGIDSPWFIDSGEPPQDLPKQRAMELVGFLLTLWDPTLTGKVATKALGGELKTRLAGAQAWFDKALSPRT